MGFIPEILVNVTDMADQEDNHGKHAGIEEDDVDRAPGLCFTETVEDHGEEVVRHVKEDRRGEAVIRTDTSK